MMYPLPVYPFLCFLNLKIPSLRLLPLHPKKLLNLVSILPKACLEEH